MSETPYIASGYMELDLDRLRLPMMALWTIFIILRDLYKADLVNLIVNEGGYCGIAYQMTKVDANFAPFGFSVVLTDVNPSYDCGHEFELRPRVGS
jgi:peptidyl-Asp metalloendopeptidase